LFDDNRVTAREGVDDLDHVIVLLFAMDPKCFRESCSPAIREETRRGYARMEDTGPRLGDFIAELGFDAQSAGNGEAASVPLAVASGLGSVGRSGMLLSERFGPCLRIGKVFTNMPLASDIPSTSPLSETCFHCGLCAGACPPDAIEKDPHPAADVWTLDCSRCEPYWRSTELRCAACISTCPATWSNA
jgi:epoxyqueuosine reductase QueG